MADPIAQYFAEFPEFDYRPQRDWRQIGPFNALAYQRGWNQERRKAEYDNLKASWTNAIEAEFADSSLERYQNLCIELKLDTIPNSVKECKRVLSRVNVNIVDLMQYRKDRRDGLDPEPVLLFDSAQELQEYTMESKKWYPADTARAEMLRVLLKVFA